MNVLWIVYEVKNQKLALGRCVDLNFQDLSMKIQLCSIVEEVAGRKCLKANSHLYDLPRKSNEVRINDYNPAILLAWEGNMNIQFIGEKSAILNWYCTQYTTKAEKSHRFDDITSTR